MGLGHSTRKSPKFFAGGTLLLLNRVSFKAHKYFMGLSEISLCQVRFSSTLSVRSSNRDVRESPPLRNWQSSRWFSALGEYLPRSRGCDYEGLFVRKLHGIKNLCWKKGNFKSKHILFLIFWTVRRSGTIGELNVWRARRELLRATKNRYAQMQH